VIVEWYNKIMDNNNPGNIDHSFLADLLDDMTQAEIVSMLNWMAVNEYNATRANIQWFRKHKLEKM
jgi:hypothetical protein